MDAFEQVIAEILWREGYWVRTSFKVELTKEDKQKIGRPSSPRWELDVVAYKAKENLIKVLECKSYLDSPGVRLRGFDSTDEKAAKRYKLFNDPLLREVVFDRLRHQLIDNGSCLPGAEIRLCLACGKIASEKDRAELQKRFGNQEWELFDDAWLKDRLKHMSKGGYENQVSAVVAKLLLR